MKKNNRRSFFGKVGVLIGSFFLVKINDLFSKTPEKIHFANGFKVSEVSQNEAIILTRLCSGEKPIPISHQKSKKEGRANNYYPIDFDEEQDVDLMDGAVSGTAGSLRVKFQEGGNEIVTDWYKAEEHNDHTVQIPVSNLKPGKKYKIQLEAKLIGREELFSVGGTFKTAHPEDFAAQNPTRFSSACGGELLAECVG